MHITDKNSHSQSQGRGKRILSELSSKPLNIKFIFKIIFILIIFSPINVLSNIRKCCLYSTTCEIITIFTSTHSLGSVNLRSRRCFRHLYITTQRDETPVDSPLHVFYSSGYLASHVIWLSQI
jgi:hypothetical protein